MSNLSASTRPLWEKTTYKQVYIRLILLFMLLKRKQVMKAGTEIKATIDFEEMDGLFQEYGENDVLTGGKTTVLKTIRWYAKFAQLPIVVSGKDWRLNMRGGGGDGQIVPLPQYLVEKGQRGFRLGLNKAFYRAGATTRDGDIAGIQGVPDALTHDITYGGLTRATTVTNKLFQGASLDDTFADWDTAMIPTIGNFRACIDQVSMFREKPGDIIAITSNTIYRDLQSAVEGQRHYVDKGPHAKYGFTSMSIDDVEVFAEPWLSSNRNSDASDTVKYFMLLHLPDWRFHVDPGRPLGNLTEFFDQSSIQGGKDEYMARVKVSCNLTCHQPNASMFKSNVSL